MTTSHLVLVIIAGTFAIVIATVIPISRPFLIKVFPWLENLFPTQDKSTTTGSTPLPTVAPSPTHITQKQKIIVMPHKDSTPEVLAAVFDYFKDSERPAQVDTPSPTKTTIEPPPKTSTKNTTVPVMNNGAAKAPRQSPLPDPKIKNRNTILDSLSRIVNMVHRFNNAWPDTRNGWTLENYIRMLGDLAGFLSNSSNRFDIAKRGSRSYSLQAQVEKMADPVKRLKLQWHDDDPRLIMLQCLDPFVTYSIQKEAQDISHIFYEQAQRIIEAIQEIDPSKYQIERLGTRETGFTYRLKGNEETQKN